MAIAIINIFTNLYRDNNTEQNIAKVMHLDKTAHIYPGFSQSTRIKYFHEAEKKPYGIAKSHNINRTFPIEVSSGECME